MTKKDDNAQSTGDVATQPETKDSESSENNSTTQPTTVTGAWTLEYYVDEFDEPTDEAFLYAKNISGTFSNSATTDSNLYVELVLDKENFGIFLYEYGRNLVKNNSANYVDEYSVTMKTSDGTKHSLSGTLYCGDDRVIIEGADRDAVIAALSGSGTVSFGDVPDFV